MRTVRAIERWFNGPSLVVYVACKMTGRDKVEMVHRAEFICDVLKQYEIRPISPVIEEHVESSPGKLLNKDEDRLKGFWSRDKQIIRRIAHAVLFDQAESKSFGMEREYCLARGVCWKPVVLLLSQGHGCSVAKFEDDGVFYSAHAAAEFLGRNWLSRWQRWKWRMGMLNRSLPKWFVDQCLAWR